jgi:hypothetical protein
MHGSRAGRSGHALSRVRSSRVELASAGELILHNDGEMANEQSGSRDQLSNNNKIHNQILYVFQARAVYVSRFAPRRLISRF